MTGVVHSRWVQFRQELGGKLLQGALAGLSYMGRVKPHFWANRSGFQVEKDIPYSDAVNDPFRMLNVYTPTSGERPFPTVFFVHGGGFRILSKDTHWMMAHTLVRRGFLVVSINYRMVPKVRFPVPAQDVCAAFKWMVNHAEALGADLERLVLMGESAGANLSSMLALALTQDNPEPWVQDVQALGIRPKALVPQCGIMEVHGIERYQGLDVPTWMADRIERVANDYLGPLPLPESRLASPLWVLENQPINPSTFPSTFAPCGDKDPILDDTIRLGKALKSAGVEAEAPVYSGGGHAFHAFGTSLAKTCWKDTFAFLDRHLP